MYVCILFICLLQLGFYWNSAIATDSRNQNGAKGIMHLIQGTLMNIWTTFVAHIPYLVTGMVIMVFTWVASKFTSKLLSRVLDKTQIRSSLRELADRFAVIGVWVMGFLIAAMVVFPGLTPAKALGAMGIASIAVGFAFKDIFENFFAGILILWRFPFEKGDFIECKGITGKVEKVSIRMTEIRLTSGELVVIPNSILFKNPVEVLTGRTNRRAEIIVGIAYGENVENTVKVISKALQDCKTVDSGKEIQIFPHAFGPSSIDIEIAWWTDPTPFGIRRSKGEVITAVKAVLDDAQIEIPFPHRTLTFKEPLQTNVFKE